MLYKDLFLPAIECAQANDCRDKGNSRTEGGVSAQHQQKYTTYPHGTKLNKPQETLINSHTPAITYLMHHTCTHTHIIDMYIQGVICKKNRGGGCFVFFYREKISNT